MKLLTCYQPHPADLDRRGHDVAHAVDNTDPMRSVAGEYLYRNPVDEVWPGRGPACHSCAAALGLSLAAR